MLLKRNQKLSIFLENERFMNREFLENFVGNEMDIIYKIKILQNIILGKI